MNILILSAAPNSSATKSIINAVKKRGHTAIVKDPAYLYLLVSENVSGFDRIYDGFDKQNTPERLKAKDIDAIISRIGGNLEYGAAVLEHLNNNLKIFSTQKATGIKIAANKLISTQKLSQAKIKVPQTILGDRAVHAKWMIEQIGGLPSIAKGLKGSQGKSIYPLNDEYQSNVFLSNFYHKKDNLLLQNMIDSGGKDIRAIVIDGKVIAAMERTAKDGELRSNISQGGSGKKIALSDADKQICIDASRACGLEVSGVDLMKAKDGTTFVIEVNGNYGYQIESITGIDISTPLVVYCEDNYKKGNKAPQATPTNRVAPVRENVIKEPEEESFAEILSRVTNEYL